MISRGWRFRKEARGGQGSAGRDMVPGRKAPGFQIARFDSNKNLMILDEYGIVIFVSDALRKRLSLNQDSIAGRAFRELVVQPLAWLSLPPLEWPGELPVMTFASATGRQFHFSGFLENEADTWVLRLVDISETLLTLHRFEHLNRLFQINTRHASKLRNSGKPGLVIGHWLEELALCFGITRAWVVTEVENERRLAGVFPTAEPFDDSAILAEFRIKLAQVAGPQTQQGLIIESRSFLLVPYRDAGGSQCWLYLENPAVEGRSAWFTGEHWQHSFSIVAEPLVRLERQGIDTAKRRRMESLEILLSGGWWEFSKANELIQLADNFMALLDIDPGTVRTIDRARWLELLDPRDREEFAVKLDAADKETFSCTARLSIKGIGYRWYLFEGMTKKHETGELVTGFALDIHDLYLRESEASAAKSRLQGLVDSAPGIIYLQSCNDGLLELTFCSGRLQEILGWSYGELRKAGFPGLVHPQDRQSYFDHVKQLLRSGAAGTQYRIRDTDDNYRWLQDHAMVLRDDKGVPEEVVGVCLDITDLKQAFERVHRSEESYRVLVEDSPAIIYRYTPDLKITFANRLLGTSLGMENPDLAGIDLGALLSADDRESLLSRIASITPHNPVTNAEICLTHQSRLRWWSVAERGIFDAAGNLLEIHAVGRDDTDIQATRRQLYQASKLATLGEMATGLAHEINQPLNVLHVSIANLLGRIDNNSVDTGYLKTKLERIFDQVKRVSGIVDHMRTFGRQSDWAGVSFDPRNAVEGALILLKKMLDKTDISVDLDLQFTGAVVGHPDRLEQVIINLIVNAIYALDNSPGRGDAAFLPKIRIATEADGDKVFVRIADNGPGIKPEIQERIFEPFFTTKPVGDGTGLGLSLSYAIIKQMSGTLDVRNLVTGGAQFTIELPKQASPT